MAQNPNLYHAWHLAKGVAIAFVVSFAAGWLTRELLTGKMSAENKAAAFILDLTLFVMLSVLLVLGAKRWKSNQLTQAAKSTLILSIVVLILMFIVGWASDVSLK